MPAFTASYQKYTLLFKKPAGTSRGALRTRDTFFIRLADRVAPGHFGIGECGPLAGLSVDDRPDFEAKLAEVCRELNRGCPPAALDLAEFPALAFGLEMALLDWQGGGRRQLFQNNFSLGQVALPTHGLIWMASRVEMLRQVHHKVRQGFTCFKLKVGALDFEEERELLADIRRAYPADQIELRLDANGAFRPDNALERLAALAEFDIHAIEQPLEPGQWPALAALCRQSPIAIALDEELIGVHTIAAKRSLLRSIRPQYIVIKPSLIGGFTAAEEWIGEAQNLGVGWWVNSMLESNIGLNAICQWVGSLETNATQGLGSGQLYSNNISAPIKLVKAGLIYDPCQKWDMAAITA